MARSIKIAVGGLELRGMLLDTPTAEAIWAALPIKQRVGVWGGEFYFPSGVSLAEEAGATERMEVGALAYWPPGQSFCIFFGPTPASRGSEPRMADPGNVFGKLTSVPVAELSKIRSGAEIVIERVEE
ncbi:MAG: hypothetical protein FJ029_15840 [Actinobacteria bacterium]|nr:hypothetical protein [Actinomycetota bacterium]